MRPSPHAVVGPSASLEQLSAEIVRCRKCPRLVRYRERIAREGSFRDGIPYWGKPVPGFGDPGARLLVVGLAPAARGANRTGRIFTGDRSAAFLTAALFRAGWASQPTSTSRDDGLSYRDAYITAAVRCVPPDNRPSSQEERNCLPFLVRELRSLPRLRAILGLGKLAWDRSFSAACLTFGTHPRKVAFAHGAKVALVPGGLTLWGAYHPSPRNTQTGLLSEAMFDRVLGEVRRYLAAENAASNSANRGRIRS